MLKNIYYSVICIFLFIFEINGQVGAIKGIIKDAKLRIPIPNVNITISELQLFTSSDDTGYYSFKNIKEGRYTLTFSRIGYTAVSKKNDLFSKETKRIDLLLRKSEIMLGESVITSMRTARIVKDVPLPVDLIDEETIERTIQTTASDVMEKASGVSLIRDGIWATSVNIRGLSKQNIVYLIDGNRIETSTNIAGGLSLIDLYNVKNIEIVKGGLSSLYGTGATGGVININTNNKSISNSFRLNGSLSSGLASVNNNKTASVNLSASDKIWYADFRGTIRTAGDTKIPGGILTNSGYSDKSLSFLVGVFPFENIELKFNYQNFIAKDVGIPGGKPFPASATASYPSASRKLYSAEIMAKQCSNTLTNLKLKYYNQLISRKVEIIPNSNVVVEPEADHNTNGLLLQADWTLAQNHFLITGVDAWQRSYIGDRSTSINSLKKVIIDKPIPNSKFATLGFYLNDELHLTNKFKLNIGARYDFIKVKNDQTSNPVAIFIDGNKIIPPPNSNASYDANTVYNKSWSGNLGVLYSLFNDINLTFNTAYTFRSPSLEERFQYINLGSVIYFGNPNLFPEKGISFDVGLRVWKNKLSITADAFLKKLENLVVDKQISDSSYQKQNIGKAQMIGFDTKIEYNFLPDYIIYFSAAYVNGKDTKMNEYLPQIPPLNGSLGLKIQMINYFDIDFSATFYDNQNKISKDENTTPGYIYIDCAINTFPINISLLNIEVFAGVQNIFDTSYKSHLSTYRGINLTEPGRNIYAKVKLSW